MSVDLLELALRCEKATGPDRELDCDIGLAVGSVKLADGYAPREVFGRTFSTFTGPCYTASLDAAMTLVPEGEGRWPQQDYIGPNPNNGPDGHRVKLWLSGGKKVRGEHPTSYALALCAAALRAHHTTESSNG